MEATLLQTKLFIPSARTRLVPRQRLLNRLNEGLYGKLSLVSTPAGFGKTTLVANWGHWLARPEGGENRGGAAKMCWLSLDKQDNDPSRFLAYVVAAMQTAVPDFGQNILVVLQSPQSPPPKRVAPLLVNEMARLPTRIILVLDDYQLIDNQAVHRLLGFLLENELPQLHLALTTRVDPPLPLARFRARGQMTELRAVDLRFTIAEAASFLNQFMGLSLSTEQIGQLEERTEGWIAGLQLAALSLQGQHDTAGFITAFTGSHRYVMDYLTDEALLLQNDETRDFLYQTSILRRLTADLCDQLIERSDSQAVLTRLEQANLFTIPMDNERRWYRYHQLFADLLQQRLRQQLPSDVPRLHKRAASYLAANGDIDEAVYHALNSKDMKYAVELMSNNALDLLRTGQISTLLRWKEDIPGELVHDFPLLFLRFTWAMMLAGELETAVAQLSVVTEHATLHGNYDELRGELAAVHAYLAAQQGDFEQAFAQANSALNMLAADNHTVRAVLAFVLGGIHFMEQEFTQAMALFEEAGQLGARSGNLNVAVSALSAKAAIQVQLGQRGEATLTYDRALKLGTGNDARPLPITASVYTGLARLNIAQEDLEAARSHAETAVALGEQWLNADSQVYGHLALSHIAYLEDKALLAEEELAKAKELAVNNTLTPNVSVDIAAVETMIRSPKPEFPAQSMLVEPVSERELEVLQLIAAGLTNKEIAGELVIALGTVKAHTASIYGKLSVRSRTQAVARARELGLI